MKETGLIHIYCGEGKGKTTAAVGLAVRHAGFGGKVVLAQFLKDGTSSECRALSKLENVTMLAANPGRTFAAATGFAVREGATLLVLDEVCAAVSCGFLPESEVLAFLDGKPDDLEVVLTGRNPSEALQARADYITEMVKRRHPFDKGIGARKGIEL